MLNGMTLLRAVALILGFASLGWCETVMIETGEEIAAFKVMLETGSTGQAEVLPGSFAQGWLFAANTEQPGAITIGAVSTRPKKGTGKLAVIKWLKGKGGRLIVRMSEARNISGRVVPARVWIK